MPSIHTCTKKHPSHTTEWVILINETKRIRYLRFEGIMIVESNHYGLWLLSRITVFKKAPSLRKINIIINNLLMSKNHGK